MLVTTAVRCIASRVGNACKDGVSKLRDHRLPDRAAAVYVTIESNGIAQRVFSAE